jgi:hypothetical protein
MLEVGSTALEVVLEEADLLQLLLHTVLLYADRCLEAFILLEQLPVLLLDDDLQLLEVLGLRFMVLAFLGLLLEFVV